MKNKKRELYLFFGVLAVILLVTFYYGTKKEYLYEDEVLSYTAANNPGGLYYKIQSGEWMTGDSLKNELCAVRGNEFDYQTVMKNQISDTHPPLYFLILHTICSFVPGTFSKWLALSINMAALLLTLFIFYKMIRELFPERPYFAAAVCLLFGLSLGTLTQVMFLRMYMLLQVFVMACCYLHVHSLMHGGNQKSRKTGFYLQLLLLTVLGTMTHYYYLIFAFFMAAFYCIYLLVKKQYRSVAAYVGTMTAAGIIVLLGYPAIWTHLMKKEVGSSAFHQDLSLSNLYGKYHTMLQFVNTEVWGGQMKLLLLCAGLLLIYLVIYQRQIFQKLRQVPFSFFLLAGVSLCYFGLVSTVTPYLCDRYVYPVFPVILLFTVLFLELLCENTLKSKRLGYCLILVLGLLPCVLQLRSGMTDVNKEIMLEDAEKYHAVPCVFSTAIPVEENVFELQKYQEILPYDFKEKITDQKITSAEELIVYVSNEEDPESYLQKITEANPSLTGQEKLYTAYYSDVYYLHK